MVVAACYLFGYWGSFNINVLEFISFADMAKLATYPLLIAFIFLFVTAFIILLFHTFSLPPDEGVHIKKMRKFGRKHWRILTIFLSLIIVLLAILVPEPDNWFYVAGLIPIYSVHLGQSKLLIELIPNRENRLACLIVLLSLPGLAFAMGRHQAFDIKTGDETGFFSAKVVDTTRSKLPASIDIKEPVF